jgi:beta-glucosidase
LDFLKTPAATETSSLKFRKMETASFPGSVEATTKDFDKSEEDNFLKMAYAAATTEYKDSLKAMGIVFDDQPTPKQKEQIMVLLKQHTA